MIKYFFKLVCILGILMSACTAEDKIADTILPKPFEAAKKGQWVIYRIAGRQLQRSKIVEVNEQGCILIQVEACIDGEFKFVSETTIMSDSIRETKIDILRHADDVSIKKGIRDIQGKTISTIIIDYSEKNKWNRIVLSKDVPLYGEVLIESPDLQFPISELVDYKN